MDKKFVLQNLSQIRQVLFKFYTQLKPDSSNKLWAKELLERADKIIQAAESGNDENIYSAFNELTLLMTQAFEEKEAFAKYSKRG